MEGLLSRFTFGCHLGPWIWEGSLKLADKSDLLCLNSLNNQYYVMLCYVILSLSHVHLFANTWIVAHQTPLSMGFSRQEYWSGLPFPSPADLPNPGIKPRSPHCRQTLYCLSHQGNTEQIVLYMLNKHFLSFWDSGIWIPSSRGCLCE